MSRVLIVRERRCLLVRGRSVGGRRLGSARRSKTGAARFNVPRPKVLGEKHHRMSRQEIQLYCLPLIPSQVQVPLAEELVSIAGRQNRLSKQIQSEKTTLCGPEPLHLHLKKSPDE